MNDIVFFLKLFFLTLALVLVMQIQVGERSLESHAMSWVQTSAVVAPLNSVAHGGAKMVHDVVSHVHSAITRNTGKKKKEEKTSSSFHWTHWRSEQSSKNDSGEN